MLVLSVSFELIFLTGKKIKYLRQEMLQTNFVLEKLILSYTIA